MEAIFRQIGPMQRCGWAAAPPPILINEHVVLAQELLCLPALVRQLDAHLFILHDCPFGRHLKLVVCETMIDGNNVQGQVWIEFHLTD